MLAGAVAITAGTLAVAAPGATAAEAPGPAYVDRLADQLQPLRDAAPGDAAAGRDDGLTIAGGAVQVDVYVDGDAGDAAGALRAAGMQVDATAESPLPVAEGWVPLDALATVARLGRTDAVVPVLGPLTDVGAVTSEGVEAHDFPQAIANAGTDGDGVEVGIISDSINQVNGGIATSQATGDLPPRTRSIKEDATGSDEGRAMAEIVYDEAPGLRRITFASGTLGSISKADSIDRLVEAGVGVIADDITYLGEPFFQDGTISQAVDRAKAAGVAYLASAGNRARQSWEGRFSPASGNPTLEDFDPGVGEDTRNCFSHLMRAHTDPQKPPDEITIVLQWAEPWGRAASDFDLWLYDSSGNPLTQSESRNPAPGGTGLPIEFVTYQNKENTPVTPCVEIKRVSGSGTPLLKWIEVDNYDQGEPTFDTASPTINPDAAAAEGSLAIAAVNASDPGRDTPESFSSRGPAQRLFDVQGNPLAQPEVRSKPSLAAADGVTTSVPGFSFFRGTSAATPSAAGIATLLRATNPDATVNEIYRVMTDPANAIPCVTATPTQDCGAGFLLADRAVGALDRTGARVTVKTRPPKPDGRRGWFTKTVEVRWKVSDRDSAIEKRSGCGRAEVSRDGKEKLTCRALSGGGPGKRSIRIKRDAKPPSKPRIKGIGKGETYEAGKVPKVKCKSKDRTSGLRSCKVKGVEQSRGRHRVKAVATDLAGNKSKSSLRYRVK
jgi:hypothetical protein